MWKLGEFSSWYQQSEIFTGSLFLCHRYYVFACLYPGAGPALSFRSVLQQKPRACSSAIHKLAKLSSLYLTGCSMIQSLPELPPNLILLDVSGCKMLQALPSNLGKLRWKYLCFDDCPRLDKNLPKEMVQNFPIHATCIYILGYMKTSVI
ncbi:unnamed protein product [Linum tenue]|uniref:Uncharacterized protein n=1 Tax=Linum tenue TaxID=586396 RepID=A0AAV0P0E3_9ROSI|nr:unnamed protein product [Linum tenue]